MNKSKFIHYIALFLFISNLVLAAFLYLGKPKQHKKEGPKKIIIERLHFDDDQIKQYEALIDKHQIDIKGKEKQLMEVKEKWYLELLQPKREMLFDSLQEEIKSIQADIEIIHFNHFHDIKKLCRADQQKYYEEFVKDITKLFHMNGKREGGRENGQERER